MGRMARLTMLSLLLILLHAGTTWAIDITIPDLNSSSATGWYGQQEDDEVEPGMVQAQEWDLEQFILEGTTLELVGGYDFKDGRDGYMSGDIFIGGADVLYGPDAAAASLGSSANGTMKNLFNYDYAIDLVFDPTGNHKYNVYRIDSSTDVETAVFYNYGTGISNQASNPIELTNPNSLTIAYTGDLVFVEKDVVDDKYHLAVDIGFLLQDGWAGDEFISHFSMQCGNDNLMGKGTAPVPEPTTIFLLGTGLIGLAGVCRKKLFKA